MLIPVSERFSINTEQFFVHEMRSALRLTVNRFARLLSIIISPFRLFFQGLLQEVLKHFIKILRICQEKSNFSASIGDLIDMPPMHG